MYSNETVLVRQLGDGGHLRPMPPDLHNKSNFLLPLSAPSSYKVSHFQFHLYLQKAIRCATVAIAINPISQFDTHRVYHSFNTLSSGTLQYPRTKIQFDQYSNEFHMYNETNFAYYCCP